MLQWGEKAGLTFVPLLLLLCQVLCADLGYHAHIVYRVNLEGCVQKTVVTRGIESQHKHSKTRNAEAESSRSSKIKARSGQQPSGPQIDSPPGMRSVVKPCILRLQELGRCPADGVSSGLLLLRSPVICGALLTVLTKPDLGSLDQHSFH